VPRHARLALECGDAEAACAVRDFFDRSFALEVPLRHGVDTLRLRLRAGACVPPFACGVGRETASLGTAEVRLSLAELRDGACAATATLQGPGGGGELRMTLHLLPLAASRAAVPKPAPEAASPSPFPTETWRYEPLCFVQHRGTDTQAAVWRSRRGCTVAVAFRGTEPGSARDVATDVRTTNRCAAPVARFAFADGAAEPLAQARVHAGFAAAYASVRRHVRAALDAALQGHNGAGPAATLLVTGHSLGGALATLCAADVAETWHAAGLPAARRPLLLVHTFGSPRVGDAHFASRFAQLVPHALRFVAGKDLVPSLPPAAMGFAHAGAGVHLPHTGLGDEHAARELPGTDYERDPGEIAASAASGLGLKHHLLGHYQAALQREHAARERRRGARRDAAA